MSFLITDQLYTFIGMFNALKSSKGPGSPAKSGNASAAPATGGVQTRSGKKVQPQQDGQQEQPELTEADLNPSRMPAGAQPMSGISGQSVEDKRVSLTSHSLANLTSGFIARARAAISSVGKFLPGASPVPAAAASAPPQSPRVALRGSRVTFADCATPGPERPQRFAGAPAEIVPDDILEGCGAGAAGGTNPEWEAVRAAARTPFGSGNPRYGPRGLHGSNLARADGFGSDYGPGPAAAGLVMNLTKDVHRQHGAQEALAKQHTDQMGTMGQSLAALMDKVDHLQATIARIEQVSPAPAAASDDRVLDEAGAREARPAHGLKALKPDKFSGKVSQAEALAWFVVTERYAQSHGCAVADVADYLMQGRARVWLVDVRNLYAAQKRALNDEAFKAEFVREYARDAAELRRDAREQILRGRLVMFADETVAHYRNRAVLLFFKAEHTDEEDQIFWVLEGMRAHHSELHGECILNAAGKRHASLQALWDHALDREQKLKELSAGKKAAGGSGGSRPWGAQRDKGAGSAVRSDEGGKGGRFFGKHRSGSNGNGPSFGPQLAVVQAQKRGPGALEDSRPSKAVRMAVDSGADGATPPTVAAAVGGSATPGHTPQKFRWCDKTKKLWELRDCVPISQMADKERAAEARNLCNKAGACYKCYRQHLAKDCTQ